MINPASMLEEASGLMEVERYDVFDALHLADEDPAIVAESYYLPGFTAAGDTFNLIMVLLEILLDVDSLQNRLEDDLLVTDRKIQEDRETLISLILILAGAAGADGFNN